MPRRRLPALVPRASPRDDRSPLPEAVLLDQGHPAARNAGIRDGRLARGLGGVPAAAPSSPRARARPKRTPMALPLGDGEREAMAESYLGSEAMLLARSGWLGCSASSTPLLERADPTFSKRDGSPAALPSALSVGLSEVASGTRRPAGRNPARGGTGRPCLADGPSSGLLSSSSGRRRRGQRALAHLARMSEIYAALGPTTSP